MHSCSRTVGVLRLQTRDYSRVTYTQQCNVLYLPFRCCYSRCAHKQGVLTFHTPREHHWRPSIQMHPMKTDGGQLVVEGEQYYGLITHTIVAHSSQSCTVHHANGTTNQANCGSHHQHTRKGSCNNTQVHLQTCS